MAEEDLVLNPSGGGPTRDPIREVIGRDSFVDQLIEHLAYTNVQMYAPRRLGKSWVLQLLKAKAPEGIKAVYLDLEGSHNTYELIQNLCRESKLVLPRIGAAIGKIIEKLAVSGTELKNYQFPWKEHLDRIFEEMNKSTVWLLLDEFPLFLNNLIVRKEHQVATEFLDYLRYARQRYPNIKFVLTGSIGLHWIIPKLEGEGWRNPQNDDVKISLGPLDPKFAQILAEGLLRGVGGNVDMAKELAEATSGYPFYIQKAITLWSDRRPEENVLGFCDRIAQKLEDPFEFNDLHKRLGHYFGRSAMLARKVIYVLSGEGLFLPKEIAAELNSDLEDILNILGKLEMDGYTENQDGGYCLTPPLFRRWWRAKRGGLYE